MNQNPVQQITDSELEYAYAFSNYHFYVQLVHRGLYNHGRHTRLICDELRKIESGESSRIILTLPPRHSKSMTVTETLPSYFIGKNPDRRVILVSYSAFLAQRFGRANKRKLDEFGYDLFGINISKDNASATNWGIKGFRGGMISAGIGSGITGEGADLLLIDDPIKNRQEADSITYRDMVWNEWQNTLLTRLQPDASVIIILTRWHEDDLVGRLLEQEPDRWKVISMPCEAEENDILGRQPGEPLWPEFGFDNEWLKRRRQEVGERAWNALYQQRPAPSEGAILKRHWWRYWEYPSQELNHVAVRMPDSGGGDTVGIAPTKLPDNFEQMVQSWDMAFKDKGSSSYVVGQVWGIRGADKFLIDQVRAKLDFPATVRAFRDMTAKYPMARAKYIEDAANGPAIIASLKKEIGGMIPVRPQGSKEARCYAVSADVEAGNVYLPHPNIAPWIYSLIDECASVPGGAYDDQCDALTQALIKLSKPSSFNTSLPKKSLGL